MTLTGFWLTATCGVFVGHSVGNGARVTNLGLGFLVIEDRKVIQISEGIRELGCQGQVSPERVYDENITYPSLDGMYGELDI